MMHRHAFETMGTVVSLAAETELSPATVAAVRAVFDRFDARFSLYRPDSELSRVATGELALLDASDELRSAYADSLEWRSVTRGAFTPHRPDGVVDLSGIVKALAVDAAGAVLDAAGSGADRGWAVDAGGDVLVRRGRRDPVIGIADPARRGALVASVTLPPGRRAVATSGVSERGEHVWGPRADFEQVTVVADGIVEADVLATALLAGGAELCDEVARTRDCDVLAVRRDGVVVATPGIRLGRRAA